MRCDIDDISNRLKMLENAIINDDNNIIITILDRAGKIAHTLKFKPKSLLKDTHNIYTSVKTLKNHSKIVFNVKLI